MSFRAWIHSAWFKTWEQLAGAALIACLLSSCLTARHALSNDKIVPINGGQPLRE